MSSYFFACCQTNPSKELIIYIYIEYQFPFEIIFKHETFAAITNNNADANQNGNIPRMEKSAQPFLFVSCYFLFPTSTGQGRLKFPRQRLAKGKASKQFEAAKCADGTMSPLIESGRDLCISGGRLSFSNLRVHATPVRRENDACVQIISDAAAWKNSNGNLYSSPDGAPLAYPQGYENIGRY